MNAPTPTITRQQRARRQRAIRGRTISAKRTTQRELAVGRALYPETDYWRPQTRGDCSKVPRPCPYAGCRWNLYLDVNPQTGAIKLNFPDLEPCQMGESCVLDVAARGGAKLEVVGALINVVRERVRQIEVRAKLRVLDSRALDEER